MSVAVFIFPNRGPQMLPLGTRGTDSGVKKKGANKKQQKTRLFKSCTGMKSSTGISHGVIVSIYTCVTCDAMPARLDNTHFYALRLLN